VGRKADEVTDAELGVLEVLWEQGPVNIRTVAEILYPGGGRRKSATVLKLLERLERKGFVERDRTGGILQFHVLVDREALIGSQLRQIAERLAGSSFTPLLAHLVRSDALTDEERTELRKMLDQARPQDSRGPGPDAPRRASRRSR